MTSSVLNYQFPSSFFSCNQPNTSSNRTEIIVDDDEDVIMYEPVKKQKVAPRVVHTITDNDVNSEVSLISYKTSGTINIMLLDKDVVTISNNKEAIDPRKKIFQMQDLSQNNHKYTKQQSIEVINLESDGEDTSDEVVFMPSVASSKSHFLNQSGKVLLNRFPAEKINLVEKQKDLDNPFEFPRAGLRTFQNTPTLGLESPRSKLFSCLSRDALSLKICQNIENLILSKHIDPEETTEKAPLKDSQIDFNSQNEQKSNDVSCNVDDFVIPPVELDKCAVIPDLIDRNNTHQDQRIKRKLRFIWSPERLDNKVLESCLEKMSQVIGVKITNQEKGIKLLMKFDMNIDAVIAEIKKNKFFYKNHFRPDSRLLRNRVLLL